MKTIPHVIPLMTYCLCFNPISMPFIVIQLRGWWCLLFMAFYIIHESAYKTVLKSP